MSEHRDRRRVVDRDEDIVEIPEAAPASPSSAGPAPQPELAEEPVPEVGGRIVAEDLGLRTRRGWTFRHVSFDVPAGAVATIVGPARSGRSTLLLTIAGHMRPSEGRALVDGRDVVTEPAAVRRAVGLGLFEGLNDLEGDLAVADLVRRELTLHPGAAEIDTAQVLEGVGLDLDTRTPAEELVPLERTLLGVALALVGSPNVIVVDDVDRDLGTPERAIVWSTLKRIAGAGTTVLTSCTDHEASHDADLVLDLEAISSKEG